MLGLGCGTQSSPSPGAQHSSNGGAGTGTGGSAVTATAGTSSNSGGVAGDIANAGSTNATGGAAGSLTGGVAGSAGAVATDFCAARDGMTFCESFEDQPAGPASAKPPWTPSINGEGELSIDTSVAHGGSHALKAHGDGFSTFLVLSGELLPSQAGPLYVRTYVRLAEAMSAGHNTFLVADTTAAPGAGNAFRLGEMNAMLMYTVSGDTHGALANDNYYSDHLPGAALEPLTWACLEVALDSQKPEIQVWLDGAEIADLHHSDWPLDPYDSLRFGFEKYAGPVSDVWYDDIAIGTTRIGCR
jgi:hypothetical protein